MGNYGRQWVLLPSWLTKAPDFRAFYAPNVADGRVRMMGFCGQFRGSIF